MKKTLLIIISIFILTIICTNVYSKNIQKEFSDGVVRFHVLANSDSAADQSLKLRVRDAVLSDMESELKSAKTSAETLRVIEKNIERIQHTAQETVCKNGYGYAVKSTVQKDYFPTKKYGDITLPAGEYNALRIEIGSAEGHNWWCVMFPPLCYVDVTKSEIPQAEKQQLKNSVGSGGYHLAADNSTDVKIKLKVVEMWNKAFA